MTRNRILAAMLAAVACVAVVIVAVPRPSPEQRELIAQHGEPRSPHWPKVRKEYMAEHPDGCACCGSKVDPQVHHVKPFHLFPELELDKGNLIWLCGPKASNHHLHVGHRGNYADWNPNVREDAARMRNLSWDDREDENRVCQFCKGVLGPNCGCFQHWFEKQYGGKE